MDKSSRKRLLPSVDELIKQSKQRKGVISVLRDAHKRMKDTDFVDVSGHDLEMLSEEELVCWLVVKLGFQKAVKLFSALNFISRSVPAKQRIEIICNLCDIPESEYKGMEALLYAIDEQHVDPAVHAFEGPLILAPLVSHCYDCNRLLTYNHVATVKCYTLSGAKRISKVTLRCKGCAITYNYAQFGDKSKLGFRYYPSKRKYVEVSDTVYFDRQLLELQCGLA